MVENAINTTGDSVNINSSTGGHSLPSAHAYGRAIDTHVINCAQVSDPASHEPLQYSKGIGNAAIREFKSLVDNKR